VYIHMGFPLMAVVELQDHNKVEVNGTQGRKGDDDGCKKCILNFLKLGNACGGKGRISGGLGVNNRQPRDPASA